MHIQVAQMNFYSHQTNKKTKLIFINKNIFLYIKNIYLKIS